jgi:hypothetical protein
LARHREEVVQTGGPEAVAQVRRDAFVLAEDDSGDDRPPLAPDARGEAPRDERAKRIRDSADTASPTDDPIVVGGQDDVYALPTQV